MLEHLIHAKFALKCKLIFLLFLHNIATVTDHDYCQGIQEKKNITLMQW